MLEDEVHEGGTKSLAIMRKASRCTFLISSNLFTLVSLGLQVGEFTLKRLLVDQKLTKQLSNRIITNGFDESKTAIGRKSFVRTTGWCIHIPR